MRILFWGTPAFAVPSLRALDDEGFEIVGVVTQPDRPAGRGRSPTSSAVKTVAEEQGFPVFTPEVPRGEGFLESIAALEPDLSIVVAYGHILRPEVLSLPPLGSLNVHASLLPELRGAAPVHWAIIRGHDKTGISIIRMTERMDAGPILHQVEEPILPDETTAELSLRLSEIGAAALVEALALLSVGDLREVEQDDASATFAPKIDRETARIDWSRSARDVANLVRGMDDVPGAWTVLAERPLKIFRPTPSGGTDDGHGAPPGTILAANGGLTVATGDGAISIGEVQPAGGRRMSAGDWVHGHRIEAGRRLE